MQKDISVEASSDAKKVPKRIAFIKARTAARVSKEDEEMAMTFPNLVVKEIIFLGLQELLHYFPPVVGGVILPALAVVALIVVPYFRVNIKREGLWKENVTETFIVLLATGSFLSLVLLLFKVYAMLIPTLLVVGCMLIPYFSRKETGIAGWLGSRPLSWWIMTWFVVIVVVLTAIGTLFRGPEWSWTWPWEEIY